MDTVHRIARAASTPWTWFLTCWALRKDVHDAVAKLVGDREFERDRAHMLSLELADLKTKLETQSTELQQAKDGNRALLRFIHTGHRLNVKFDPESIREALQRAQTQ